MVGRTFVGKYRSFYVVEVVFELTMCWDLGGGREQLLLNVGTVTYRGVWRGVSGREVRSGGSESGSDEARHLVRLSVI